MGVKISLVRVARVIFEARDDKSPLLFLVKESWLHTKWSTIYGKLMWSPVSQGQQAL